jgi:23S rRNA (pseudouridine1915-N3)-methyltransferase
MAMHIQLVAVGTRMPPWVNAGFSEYAKRLQGDVALNLREVKVAPRRGDAPDRALAAEARAISRKIPERGWLVVMDVNGTQWSTEALAGQLDGWLQSGSDIYVLIGGPDGLADEWRQRARQTWSLSPLTLPHGLVRVIVAEQLYRAWSILHQHPYHRA